MTMKKQKTLHRFAAVAAVLLAFCLVFMMPVGATGVTCNNGTACTYHAAAAGDMHYDTLQDAVNAADPESTVTVLKDVESDTLITINKAVTLDGANKKLTNTYDSTTGDPDKDSNARVINVDCDGPVTIKDLVIEKGPNSDVTRAVNIIKKPVKLNLENVQAEGFKYAINVASAENSEITISGGKYSGYAALNIHGNGTKVTANNDVELIGVNNYIKDGYNDFGTIVVFANNVDIDISGSTLSAVVKNTASQSIIRFGASSTPASHTGSSVDIVGSSMTVTTESTATGTASIFSQGTQEYGELELIIGAGSTSNVKIGEEYLADGCVCVKQAENTWVVEEVKPAFTVTVPDEGNKIDFTGPTCTNFVETDAVVEVTVKNTGNQFISLAIGYKDVDSCFVYQPMGDDLNLDPNEELTIQVCPKMQVDAGTYSEELTISAANIPELENVVIPLTFIAVNPTDVNPSINVEMSDDGMTITPSGTTTAVEVAEEDLKDFKDLGIEAERIVGITATNDMSVLLLITEATVNDDDGSVTRYEGSEVIATYVPMNSVTAEDITDSVSVALIIGMDKPDTSTLPTFSGAFTEEVASAVETENKDYKPLSMITATDKVNEINDNLADDKKSIGISFTISNDLYHQYKGKFIALHVKDGKVIGTLQVEATKDEDTGYWSLEFYGDSFSSYVLAADTTPSNLGNTGGSAVDTGSGNYQYYPRDVPTNGIVDFGTSKVVTGMELPAGSSGKVTLNIKPTFAMPENGFYAFEIDAPGYNTDAKINGGLSFQIPVADLEAAGWTAEDIVLFHGTVAEDGKIVWEALPTNLVKNENGVAYYKAAINSCSPFYIGFVKDGSVVNTEVVDPVTPETPETPVTPDEPEVLPPVDEPETPEQPTESPAPILAVLAGLGAAAVLRRK